jgi:hypothetical protein
MTVNDVLNLLASFEKRLATICDQARETREQAQHTLDRVNKLFQDVENLKTKILATADTQDHPPLSPNDIE